MCVSQKSHSINQVQDLDKNHMIIQKWPMLFTWKVVLDAFVLKLLDCEWCFFCWASISKGTTLKKGLNPWRCDWILNSGTLQRFIGTDKCASVTVIFSPREAHTWRWWKGALRVAQLMSVSGDGTWGVPVWRVRTEEFLICPDTDFAPTAHLPVQLFWRHWVWFSSVLQS